MTMLSPATAFAPWVQAVPLEEREIAVWLELIDLALSRARISQERAAIEQGITLEQWYQQRHAKGHVSLFRLFRLPVAFWREFIPITAEFFGLALPTPDLVSALRRLIRPSRDRARAFHPSTWRQGRLF